MNFNTIKSYAKINLFLEVIKKLKQKGGKSIVNSRSGEVVVLDDAGRERERYKIPYGADTEFEDGARIESVANRFIMFSNDIEHRGVSQTDSKYRIVINFNWFS